MPKLNGFQATQQLIREGGTAKVLILSMRTDEQGVRDAACSGAKGYLINSTYAVSSLTG
jgi:DNA-binding NarL/FixJ family response regulator